MSLVADASSEQRLAVGGGNARAPTRPPGGGAGLDGDGGVIAASGPGHLTIATPSAASWLYYSADNGKTWRTAVTYLDGGQGWNDLGFTTTRDGLVIHGHPYHDNMPGQLLLTGNGGLTWHTVTF